MTCTLGPRAGMLATHEVGFQTPDSKVTETDTLVIFNVPVYHRAPPQDEERLRPNTHFIKPPLNL